MMTVYDSSWKNKLSFHQNIEVYVFIFAVHIMIYVRYLVFIFFISGEHLFIYHVFMKIEIFTDEAPNEVSRELWLTCNCFLLLSHTSVLFLFLFVIYSHTSGFCYCFVGERDTRDHFICFWGL